MTIPASEIVQINPGVLSSGGTPLALNGVILSTNILLPTDSIMSFGSAAAVSSFFGAASSEYAASQNYFLGFDNSTLKPGRLYFAPYVEDDRAAWLKSGSLAGLSLTQLQAFSGVLIVTVDGVVKTSSSINLSAATSFSNAATLIEAGFTGGALTVAWNAVNSTFVITSTTSGDTSTISYGSGSIAASLKFTSATGALLSQGQDESTPGATMDSIVMLSQNWVSFTTMFEPSLDDKLLFAVWANAQNQRYCYVAWDTDAQAILNQSTTNFGYLVNFNSYDASVPVYNTLKLAVLFLGIIASIDFSRTNGRITAAFKTQSGFTPTVTDAQIATNLLENGYSFYGAYATANDQFNFVYNGQMSGKWEWVDTFVNQVYLNSQFQLALLSLLTQVTSIPYNQSGYALIRTAMTDPINQALNFGSIRTGITLSESQKAQVNQQAGLEVASIIEQQGYYLQILDPGAQVRGNRGTPVINFWYTDGSAVQQINVPSIDIM
jgi:hypothetical protein